MGHYPDGTTTDHSSTAEASSFSSSPWTFSEPLGKILYWLFDLGKPIHHEWALVSQKKKWLWSSLAIYSSLPSWVFRKSHASTEHSDVCSQGRMWTPNSRHKSPCYSGIRNQPLSFAGYQCNISHELSLVPGEDLWRKRGTDFVELQIVGQNCVYCANTDTNSFRYHPHRRSTIFQL